MTLISRISGCTSHEVGSWPRDQAHLDAPTSEMCVACPPGMGRRSWAWRRLDGSFVLHPLRPVIEHALRLSGFGYAVCLRESPPQSCSCSPLHNATVLFAGLAIWICRSTPPTCDLVSRFCRCSSKSLLLSLWVGVLPSRRHSPLTTAAPMSPARRAL